MPKNTKILWFTGLSGAGKTTLTKALSAEFTDLKINHVILDGDEIRSSINKHLKFSRDDIKENNKRLAEMALKYSENRDFVLVAAISPYRKDRSMVKKMLGNKFVEIFVDAAFAECARRDTKGLYKKALAGELKDFTGFRYEAPLNPHLHLKTDKSGVEECLKLITDHLGFTN